MNATIVAHITGYGSAGAAGKCIALIAIQAVTELYTLCTIPTTDGIGATINGATTSGWHTSIADIPLEALMTLTDTIIAIGILTTMFRCLAFRSQLAAIAIASVATIADALGFAQLLIEVAGGMGIAQIGLLFGFRFDYINDKQA